MIAIVCFLSAKARHHSIAGGMQHASPTGSALISTKVITGSHSAPNLHDMNESKGRIRHVIKIGMTHDVTYTEPYYVFYTYRAIQMSHIPSHQFGAIYVLHIQSHLYMTHTEPSMCLVYRAINTKPYMCHIYRAIYASHTHTHIYVTQTEPYVSHMQSHIGVTHGWLR